MPVRDAQTLLNALERLPARELQRLWFRFVEGRSTAECLALYGVSREAFALSLHRSARMFERALSSNAPLLPLDVPALPAHAETTAARTLLEELDSQPLAPSPLRQLLSQLQAHAPELKQLLAEKERAYLASPKAKRADLLRRIALLALLLAAGWLYLRNRS